VDDNGTGVHFLVRDTNNDNKGVGVIRLVPARGKLTRLAVLKPYRTFGLGKVLVRALEEYAAAHPQDMKYLREEGDRTFVRIKIHSQVGVMGDVMEVTWVYIVQLTLMQLPVVKFYGKLGYEVHGDEFDEEGGR
jgi:GNAT superfamily N-acetyltransferase